MEIPSSVDVPLTPELQQFVTSHVQSGHYCSAAQVLLEGLRQLEDRERSDEEAFEAFKAKVQRGAAQAERGELVHPDVVLENIAAMKRARAAERSLKAAS